MNPRIPLSRGLARVFSLIAVLAALSCAASRGTPSTAAGVSTQRASNTIPGATAATIPAPAAEPRVAQVDSDTIPVGNSPVRGRLDALVTIVEFGDFQCPFCSRVQTTIESLRARYGDDLRIVFKNNPLPFHQDAGLAAEAALAAGAQQRFWEMHDMLYQNQRQLARADLERYATYLGLDMDRFRADLDNHTYAQQVQVDQELAVRVNANGTPNFFINGTNLVGAQPVERFVTVIDQVLSTARLIHPREMAYARMTASPVPMPDAPAAPSPSHPDTPTLDPNAVYRVPVDGSPALGPANALVTIVEFGDFQCPFCQRVESTLNDLRQRYGNDVRVVWKNLPLPFHDHAMLAAEASMEAFAQRGNIAFWRMHDALFEHQRDEGGLERPALERYAQQIGLNLPRFRAALDHHTHQARIQADVDLSTRIAANGTPHFFINGRRLVGAQPVDRFATAIDAARDEARNTLHGARATPRLYDTLTARGANEPVYLPGGNAPHGADRVYTVRPNANAPFRGSATARVVIEHFSDFQCPFCMRVDPTIAQIVSTYGNRVRVVWRDYPLPFHQNAMPAAEAAREVFAQRGNDAFWRFHDLLFAHQRDGGLERAGLEQYAAQVGVDMARFRSTLDQHTHEAAIRADIAAADATGADMGTPATFVNGIMVSGAQPFSAFQAVIDAALAGRAPSAAPSPAPTAPPSPSAGQPTAPTGQQIAASHILVMYAGSMRAPSTVTRSRDEARVRAQDVLARARRGDDFAGLARQFSDEPGAGERGGALGRFGRGVMVREFEDAAFGLRVGEIGFVESQFGFHVIRRDE